ncbi:hypothetical protein HK104_008872 [Borealophlyctis nickersoniae]|nr:hypothetical protein HK104_008872 [Borealophlyctis nickersoniae]
MSSQVCGSCSKTVYQTEKVEAGNKWYHKGCFKCSDPACNVQLTLKTFKVVNNQIWCEKHVPKPKATAVADSVSVMHAMHAPKKAAEGLHKAQVGTGETPTYGLDNMSTQHALNTPKKPTENLGHVKKDPITGALLSSIPRSQQGSMDKLVTGSQQMRIGDDEPQQQEQEQEQQQGYEDVQHQPQEEVQNEYEQTEERQQEEITA